MRFMLNMYITYFFKCVKYETKIVVYFLIKRNNRFDL